MPDRAMKLAGHLLGEYGHMRTFEVDPGSREACDLLTKALEAYGCSVTCAEFSTVLTVTCPEK